MKFAVPDLKSQSKAVPEPSAREGVALSVMLHWRQPDFCQLIDEVGMDPRSVEAHRFCTIFCALAFRHAEEAVGYRLPRYPGHAIEEEAGFIGRGEEPQIGRRASGFRKRILRHVLIHSDFDEGRYGMALLDDFSLPIHLRKVGWARETRIEHPTRCSSALAQKAVPAAELFVLRVDLDRSVVRWFNDEVCKAYCKGAKRTFRCKHPLRWS